MLPFLLLAAALRHADIIPGRAGHEAAMKRP
jgi:hypothetical protein